MVSEPGQRVVSGVRVTTWWSLSDSESGIWDILPATKKINPSAASSSMLSLGCPFSILGLSALRKILGVFESAGSWDTSVIRALAI